MGAVRHGNHPHRPMLEKQPQSDVLEYYKGLMAISNLPNRRENATCIWTCGRVSVRRRNVARTTDQLPCRQLATAALIPAVDTTKFILSIFPSEKVCVEISGERITGSPKNAITDLWGEQVAQALYDRRGVV